jgi:hypothetical protein
LNLNRNLPAVYSVDTCGREGARRLELATEACDDPVEALSTKGLIADSAIRSTPAL